jgi:hypothetical protein
MLSMWTAYVGTETRQYNSLLQLTRETVPGLKDMQHIYPSGAGSTHSFPTTCRVIPARGQQPITPFRRRPTWRAFSAGLAGRGRHSRKLRFETEAA